MTAPSPPLIGEIEFLGWLGQAEPGDVLAYHRGFLAVDRFFSPDLRSLGNRALQATERGLVHLVQRRHGPEDFAYLAIARPKARSEAAELAALVIAEAA